MAGGVSSPVIISISVAAFIILSVALATILRWARTKPSTQLPPPRPAFLSPYWANQQRYSTHVGGPSDVYDEERKLTGHGSGVFKPFGEYAAGNASDISLSRGTKTPYNDGDRTPNSGVSFGHENGGTYSEHPTPQLQPNELGEISLNSPNSPRQRPSSIQFIDSRSMMRPAGSLPPNGSTLATAGGDTPQAAATDPQSSSHLSQNVPPSAFNLHSSPPRPFPSSARSRHSIAGPPVSQPPPTLNLQQVKQDRRASRMSMYSTYSSIHTHSYDPRRSSVSSFIRGPPHKTNMQIVLPQPLAPAAAAASGNYNGNEVDVSAALHRNQRRHSRVDLWTETNNIGRSKSPSHPLADLPLTTDAGRRDRRPSQGSQRSGRSLELPNSGHFVHMEPPPPLPAASSRSFLTSSRSGTPTSSFSALPQTSSSSAATTPQLSTGSSSELGHENRPGSSGDVKNASNVVDDAKQLKPLNDVKSDNSSSNIPPTVPPVEPTKDN